jgi:hypothetical protein
LLLLLVLVNVCNCVDTDDVDDVSGGGGGVLLGVCCNLVPFNGVFNDTFIFI